MREGKLNEDRDRGAQAERLLRDPLLVEAFDVLENEFMQAWRQSAVADTERVSVSIICVRRWKASKRI